MPEPIPQPAPRAKEIHARVLALGSMLKAERARRGVNLRQAQVDIGVPMSTLSRFERGQMPDLPNLLAVADWLKLPLTWFASDEPLDAYRRGWNDCAAAVSGLLAAGPVEHEGTAAERRSNTPFNRIPHGEGGYKNYGCRCEVCTPAGAAANKRQREARRAGTAPVRRREGAS